MFRNVSFNNQVKILLSIWYIYIDYIFGNSESITVWKIGVHTTRQILGVFSTSALRQKLKMLQ